jgi:hypothetical protein
MLFRSSRTDLQPCTLPPGTATFPSLPRVSSGPEPIFWPIRNRPKGTCSFQVFPINGVHSLSFLPSFSPAGMQMCWAARLVQERWTRHPSQRREQRLFRLVSDWWGLLPSRLGCLCTHGYTREKYFPLGLSHCFFSSALEQLHLYSN